MNTYEYAAPDRKVPLQEVNPWTRQSARSFWVREIISLFVLRQLAFRPAVNLQCKSPVLFLGVDIHMPQDGNFPRLFPRSVARFALIFSLLLAPAAFAQSASPAADAVAQAGKSQKKAQPAVDPLNQPLSEKQRRANEKSLHRELQETYKKWLGPDVPY